MALLDDAGDFVCVDHVVFLLIRTEHAARSSRRPAMVPSMRLSPIVMRTPRFKSGSTFWVTSKEF